MLTLIIYPLLTLVTSATQIAWDPVTHNVDGSVCDDLAGYTLYVEEQALEGPKLVTQEYGQEAYKGIDIEVFLKPGKTYKVWVDAFDASDNHSGYSNVIEIIVPDTTIPSAPSNLRVVQ